MSRISTITGLPSSAKIIAALIDGRKSNRQIATQFGVSESAVRRFLKAHLLPAAARVAAERDLGNGEGVMAAIRTEIDRLKMLDEALDQQMRDPENPDRYTAAVDALDCEVTYFEIEEGARGPVKVRHKASLQSLLASKVPNAIQVIVRRDDSRRIFIQLHEGIGNMLDRLAKVLGLIKSGNTTIIDQRRQTINEVSYTFMNDVRTALGTLPPAIADQAQEAIAVHFEHLAAEAGDGEDDSGA